MWVSLIGNISGGEATFHSIAPGDRHQPRRDPARIICIDDGWMDALCL